MGVDKIIHFASATATYIFSEYINQTIQLYSQVFTTSGTPGMPTFSRMHIVSGLICSSLINH
jgi:hypothetical protein